MPLESHIRAPPDEIDPAIFPAGSIRSKVEVARALREARGITGAVREGRAETIFAIGEG